MAPCPSYLSRVQTPRKEEMEGFTSVDWQILDGLHKTLLTGLQTRGKWHNPSADINHRSVIMLVDPQMPRSFWQIGRVVKVFPGADDHVWMAEIQIKDRVYTRPIARLVVLPEIPDDADNIPARDWYCIMSAFQQSKFRPTFGGGSVRKAGSVCMRYLWPVRMCRKCKSDSEEKSKDCVCWSVRKWTKITHTLTNT